MSSQRQRHIIKQQVLELEMSSKLNAMELQNQVSALYRSKIVPIIDATLSQLSDADTIHRIDCLEIDLGDLHPDTLETDLVSQFSAALFAQLAQHIPTSSTPSTQQASASPTSFSQSPSFLSQASAAASAAPSPQSNPLTKTTPPTSPHQALLERCQTFLYTGRVPWWSEPFNQKSLKESVDQLLAVSPQQFRALLLKSIKQEDVLQRILYQFSESTRMKILQLIAPTLSSAFQAYATDILRLKPQVTLLKGISAQRLTHIMWQGMLWEIALQQPSSPSSIVSSATSSTTPLNITTVITANVLHIANQLRLNGQDLIQQLQSAAAHTHLPSHLPQALAQVPSQSVLHHTTSTHSTHSTATPLIQRSSAIAPTAKITFPEEATEDIYIQNAGLILLWPFLSRFFTKLQLITDNQFLTPQSRHQAALLLQYLVDASVAPVESALCLNKLLCGQHLSTPLPAELELTDTEQQDCENLLSAVIQYWSALGTISPAGLQEAFLQRQGVLRSRGDHWLLQVDHKPHDILLDSLPWSIKVVTFEWMAQTLYVEW